MQLMQEFVRDYAKQSKADSEKIMQDAVTRILAGIIGAMGQQAETGKKEVEKIPENNLEISDKPLDEGAAASLAAMFRDDED